MGRFLYDLSTEALGAVIGLTVAVVTILALIAVGALAAVRDRVAGYRE
ncbi:hypothetical protein LG047_15210 [Methylocystis sp. WRRC1]|nr:hypothetical protein [Methylocystis sp. WRRC1]MCC3246649.1 hypothetical protein [Methylocystis sp. WRRC1]